MLGFSLKKAKKRTLASAFLEEEDAAAVRRPPGKPNSKPAASKAPAPAVADDGGQDPFEAFMSEINAISETQVEAAEAAAAAPDDGSAKPDRLDEQTEQFEGFDKAKDTAVAVGGVGGLEFNDAEVYAAAEAAEKDGMPAHVGGRSSSPIKPLEATDHAAMGYEAFRKDFYTEHPVVAAMSHVDVAAYRARMACMASGHDVRRPVRTFEEAGFDAKLLKAVVKAGFETPTPIQAQALPNILSGRDVVGIAKTGSGKTLAFLWPLLVHMCAQRVIEPGEGPIGLVLAPTRELVTQIHGEAKRFVKVYGMKSIAVHGGVSKWEQTKALKHGCEVVIATPGRLIDLVKSKATNLHRVTYLVLDEADRMLDMGFESQVRSILSSIRPDRQSLMFSATFKRRVEGLARDVVRTPIRITIGTVGQANDSVDQNVLIFNDDSFKWGWLVSSLDAFLAAGKVLIFVAHRAACDALATNLFAHVKAGLQRGSAHATVSTDLVLGIHGDKTQQERDSIIKKFKSGDCQVMIGTDVAARGLDIKDVRTVVNFDKAKSMDIHVHRVGRTGRMDVSGVQPGTAYTLVTRTEQKFAGDLVYNLHKSGQAIPGELLSLAHTDPKFRDPTGAGGARVGGAGASAAPKPGGGRRWGKSLNPHRPMSTGGVGFDAHSKQDAMSRFHAAPSAPAAPSGMAGFVRASSGGGDEGGAAAEDGDSGEGGGKRRRKSRWGSMAPNPRPGYIPGMRY